MPFSIVMYARTSVLETAISTKNKASLQQCFLGELADDYNTRARFQQQKPLTLS